MARELDININVVDGGAKQTLAGVDQATDSLTQRLEKSREEVAALESGFKSLGLMLGQDQAKLRALEEQVGASGSAMKDKLNPAIKEGNATMDQMDRIATRLVERMAILFALKGIESFVQGLFTAASKTADLATNLDLSTDKVQEFAYAAQQTGVPVGSLFSAVDTLGKKLAGGSDSVSYALQRLELDTRQFFDADPGEKFDQVAHAISEMGDKTERTGVEMALFGTDKIDPLIMRLQQLEKAAHDAGVVLSKEDVKALDDAKKSLEATWTTLEVTASKWLVAAQNALYYYVAARGGSLPSQVGTAGGGLPFAPDAPKPNLPAGLGASGTPGLHPLDPDKKDQLAAIVAIEREETGVVRDLIAVEKEQAALEKEMNNERLRINKLITAAIKEQVAEMTKATDALILENLAAKQRNNAAIGLDSMGNPIRKDDPFQTYNDTMEEIRTKKAGAPGANVSDLEAEANRKFLEAELAAAKANDDLASSSTNAAIGANALSQSHAGAVRASDALTQAFGQATGVFMTKGEGLGGGGQGAVARTFMGGDYTEGEAAAVASGTFVNKTIGMRHFGDGGYAASPMAAIVGDSPGGEYMVPAAQMKQLRAGAGGVSIGDIHIHGNVDSELTARRMADRICNMAMAQVGTQLKVPLTKSK